MALFGVNLLLRAVETAGEALGEDRMRFLQDGMFGWGQRIERAEALDRICETRLAERFHASLGVANEMQREALAAVQRFVRASRAFSSANNGDIGNECLLRMAERAFPGTDVELFELLCKHGIAVLPGNAFGLPIARGEATFRMTLVHEPIDELVRRLERVDDIVWAHGQSPASARARVEAAQDAV